MFKILFIALIISPLTLIGFFTVMAFAYHAYSHRKFKQGVPPPDERRDGLTEEDLEKIQETAKILLRTFRKLNAPNFVQMRLSGFFEGQYELIFQRHGYTPEGNPPLYQAKIEPITENPTSAQ